MPFKVVRNDITKMQVDVIVNTASRKPGYSIGTDTAVFEAAGVENLLKTRQKIGHLKEGEVAITKGFNLPAKYIIHVISPLYIDGEHGEEEKLRACYEKSLQLAKKKRCKSIAFPLLATGNLRFPKEKGLEIALNAIQKFLLKVDMQVYLVVFDEESTRLSGYVYNDIEAYIDNKNVAKKLMDEYGVNDRRTPITTIVERTVILSDIPMTSVFREREEQLEQVHSMRVAQPRPQAKRSLDVIINNVGETFQQRLLRLIRERGRKEVDVYKKAGKDNKFFYKIRKNVQYQPTKHTVFAFAVSLELSLDETKDLLASAGFAIAPGNKFDLIMQYVVENEIFDIYKIDCILYDFGEEQYFSCE